MSIKEIKYKKPDIYNQSILILEISGRDVNYSLINSLRIICYGEIPIYGFETENINISKYNSVDHISKQKNFLSQLPILNLNHPVIYLEDKYYKINDKTNLKHPDDNIEIEYYLNVSNNKSIEPLSVTSDDIIPKINGKVVKLNFNTPLELAVLKKNEEIEFSMKATLSIGILNSIFNASHCYHEQIDETTFRLKIESQGQMDEYEIFKRACQILIFKFQNLKLFFESVELNSDDEENNLDNRKFYIENENETTVGPLKTFLLKSENVKNCGLTRYDGYMNNRILLYVEINKKNTKIFKEIYISIEKCINFFEKLKKNKIFE
jgi:DNA-directed RNA polymerase subunit L